MAKRTRRQYSKAPAEVHALYPREDRKGWDPIHNPSYVVPSDENRDQRYVKNITPRSDGQKQLMEAIDNHNLVMALGPAGTGKTYLAVSKAVEAFE
ncbi:MAG TPA: PhoH family protein, partial [Magnetovibrio sp.]